MLGGFQGLGGFGLLLGLFLFTVVGNAAGLELRTAPYPPARLRWGIAQALSEPPSVWWAAMQPTPEAAAWTELGEVGLERYAAGHSVTLHLPSPPAEAGGRILPFTTVMCEEQPHTRGFNGPLEGTCFFYTSTTTNPASEGPEEEVFLKYEAQVKQQGSRGILQGRGALGTGDGMTRRGLSNKGSSSFSSPSSKTGVYIIEEFSSNSVNEGDGLVKLLGYVFIEEHLNVVDDFGHFSLIFRFSEEMRNRTTAQLRTWPAAFKLTGMRGDPILRASRLRTAEGSTLFYRWIFPVLLLSGLISILWISIKVIEWRHRTTYTVPTNGVCESECAIGTKKKN
ncbi:unnamed protein product [Phytomonas sp. Hart1]|nr:unnamed protein product [Phytomonas sp. Hart1]|eukprot:CCW65950.1 unnamed protein product [Phytomonas sp. isolate Hart1]